jgi:hypothetical protein
MKTSSGVTAPALALVAALASASGCRGRSEPAVPALWEPVDESFKGCEGG